MTQFFDDLETIGQLPAAEIPEKVTLMDAAAPPTTDDPESFGMFTRGPRPWQHTAHSFGYIASGDTQNETAPVISATQVRPANDLKNSRITVTLDALRIAEYPGRGMHNILVDFYGEHHLGGGQVEEVHFNQVFRGRQNESVGLVGFPIFVGLNVGTEGIAFKCFTVNVKNEGDSALLGVLDSEVMQRGLKLLNTAQPALAPLSEIAVGVTRMLAKRNENVPVQRFYMGLDFSDIVTRARLATGSYVAVQVPETANWNWNDYEYHRGRGRLVARQRPDTPIPFNYIVFGVSRYEGGTSG